MCVCTERSYYAEEVAAEGGDDGGGGGSDGEGVGGGSREMRGKGWMDAHILVSCLFYYVD